MAKFLLLVVCFFVGVSSLPPKILHQTQHQTNGYSFEYEADDGSKRREIGTFVYRENRSVPILFVKGMYSYFADGREFVVHYEAGDEGTKTRGDIVPRKLDFNKNKKKRN